MCLLLHVLIGDGEQIIVEDQKEEEDVVPPLARRGSVASVVGYFTHHNNTDSEAGSYREAIEKRRRESVAMIAQHYNPDRTLIYESTSRESNLTVAVEQVSIILTDDGTVITFFQG